MDNDNNKNEFTEIDLKNNMELLCTIENCLAIICFMILSIVFKKWWLILLSLLFHVRVKINNKEEDNRNDL